MNISALMNRFSGNPESPSNYRPILTLPIICKLLEKPVHNLLHQHLTTVHYLPTNGVLLRINQINQPPLTLISFVHECQEALDNGGEVCSVLFDLCKAFNSVPHQPLLHKLFHLQVNPFLLRWIHNYLSNRTQLCWMVYNPIQSFISYLLSTRRFNTGDH